MEKLMNTEPDTMKALLSNTVYMLCKDGFSFTRRLTIKGLIVVSVDDEAFVVQMDKKFCHSPNGDVVAVNDHVDGTGEEDVSDSIEHLRSFCEEVTNSSQVHEELEVIEKEKVIEDRNQDRICQKEISMQSINRKNKSTENRNNLFRMIKAEIEAEVSEADKTHDFLSNFSDPLVVKLETTSDNEDANELLTSINTDYSSYLEQENDASAMSCDSSPLHVLGVNQSLHHALSSASSTSSHYNKDNNGINHQLQQQIRKDIFNYDDEGRRLKSFECQYDGCSKAFFRKDHLTRHQRIKHGKPYGVESQNVYKCCGKTFYKHRSLLKHIKDTHPDRGDTSVLVVVHDNGYYEHVANGHCQETIDEDESPAKNTQTNSSLRYIDS